MKELKPYLLRSLTTSCPLKFFTNKHAGNTDKSPSQQQFPIFSPELSKMKRSVELLSIETRRQGIDFKTASSLAASLFERFSQQPTSTFLHPYFAMRKLKEAVHGFALCVCARDDVNLSLMSQSQTRSELKRECECLPVSQLAVRRSLCEICWGKRILN